MLSVSIQRLFSTSTDLEYRFKKKFFLRKKRTTVIGFIINFFSNCHISLCIPFFVNCSLLFPVWDIATEICFQKKKKKKQDKQ